MYKLCDKLIGLMNFKERFEAKFDNDISELDKVAKICSGHNKKYNLAVDFYVWHFNLMTN